MNSSQMRAVGATLRLVEQTADEVERILGRSTTGVTFQLAEDLDAEERRAVAMACDRLRAAMIEAARRLGLDPATRSLRREIRGKVSILWATLEDTKSTALRGYGSLPPEAGEVVDGLLAEINRGAIEILRAVSGAQAEVVRRE